MAKLIDEDALVAKIEKLQSEIAEEKKHKDIPMWYNGINHGFNLIKDILNTLEVKDVDLEKEIQNVIHNHFFDLNGIAIAGTSSYATVDDMVYIAKYFFELGLKVNNENEK